MSEVKNVPKLRFPQFTGDWEQRKLGDITESYSGGTPTAGKKEYYDGNIPFIRSGEISSNKTELFISDKGLKSSSAKMVETGDILYALYGATSGEVSISKLKGAINQAILAIQPHQNYDSQFLMQWLRKSKENIIGTYIQGGQGNLSGNIVKELIIDVPTYKEQYEIGVYLKNLDHLITLHQRKYDSMLEYKKGLLQKMFPKKGEKVPEIRFHGFDGEWEEKKLGDICNIKRGLTYKPSDVENTGVRVLRSSNIKDGYFVINNDDVFVNSSAINICYLKDNDILITAANGSNKLIGKHCIIKSLSENYCVAGGFMLSISYNESCFLNASMDSMWYRNFLSANVCGGNGSIGNISKNLLEKQILPIPSLEEQQKIGSFFKSLDEEIELQKQKVELIKEYKKGLLQQMFV